MIPALVGLDVCRGKRKDGNGQTGVLVLFSFLFSFDRLALFRQAKGNRGGEGRSPPRGTDESGEQPSLTTTATTTYSTVTIRSTDDEVVANAHSTVALRCLVPTHTHTHLEANPGLRSTEYNSAGTTAKAKVRFLFPLFGLFHL